MRCVFLFLCVVFVSSATAAERPVTRERVEKAVTELQALVSDEMQTTGIPGIAIAVVFDGQVLFAKGFGVREVGESQPVDADTVFPLASLSKPIGSTVIAAAIKDGKISWDSLINDLDPGFVMFEPWVTREITIRDFYAHRSGLPDHAGDLLEDIGFNREQVLYRLRYLEPSTSFRSGYAYTNFGMTEGAVAAANAMGKSWEDLSEERLYQPLGMTATSSRHVDFLKRDNRVVGHERVNGEWVHRSQRNPDAQSPAGGVTSSVNDLAKWMMLQMANGQWNGQPLLDPDALAESHHPHMLTGFNPATGMPGFYGLGWNVNYDTESRLRLSHSGAFALGAATAVFLVPAERLGVVVLTNAAPIGVAEALGMTFVEQALYGATTQDWLKIFKGMFANMEAEDRSHIADYSNPPASPAPPAPLEGYVGSYSQKFYGDLTIRKNGNGLILGLGPNHKEYALRHWDRDIFLFEMDGENLIGPSGLFFTTGPDGKARSVTVEHLNQLENGTFLRQKDKMPSL